MMRTRFGNEKTTQKISRLTQICEVHYFGSDKNFKLKVIYSIMKQIKTRGFVTEKQMRWCNDVYKKKPKKTEIILDFLIFSS